MRNSVTVKYGMWQPNPEPLRPTGGPLISSAITRQELIEIIKEVLLELEQEKEVCRHETWDTCGISRRCKVCKKWLPDPDGSIPL